MTAERLKNFVILHSNDMHGDFLAESQGTKGTLIGGLALLSGYLDKVRAEEENVLYVISGDMLQGSLIDREYMGVSTIEIMNYLAPDVVTLGNHELDYGLSHLLFLEKMANFPIVNCNMYIKSSHRRLMQPHHVLTLDGFAILFIGVITQDILETLEHDEIGTFIDLEDAAVAVGRICNAYRDQDIELTVLMTHIGFKKDKELATLLRPEWGVDVIIGGHSHTILAEPAIVNDILIAQAGVGTDQIGRFDIKVDARTNSIVDWQWQLLPVSTDLAEQDAELQRFIESYQAVVDRKYNTIVCRFARRLTHPGRDRETDLGNLIADIFMQRARSDVTLVGSGAIRRQELGPVVTFGDLREALPYDGTLYKFALTGAQLSKAVAHSMRLEAHHDRHLFQLSKGVRAVYNDHTRALESLTVHGQPVQDDERYTVCTLEYHYNQSDRAFDLTKEELGALGMPRVVTTSYRDVVVEYLRHHQNVKSHVEGRLVFK
ncbi:MAG: bifunctional UDP-sugar hydrolase/5'-nucleotidase [Anaerolineae bacterium]